MTNIGTPIIIGKPLIFKVGDAITIIGWSPNKKCTRMEPEKFPAHVLRVFTWWYKDAKKKKVVSDTMYDVLFDSDKTPDPVPPRVRQPHMYGADWANMIMKPGTKLPKAVKIPKAKKEKKAAPKKARRSLEGGN